MYIQYTGSEKFIKADTFWIDNNIVFVKTDTEPKVDGFIAYLRDNKDYPINDFSDFKTLYRVVEDGFYLSNDGSIYVEPKEIPTKELTDEEKAQKEREDRIIELQVEIQTLKDQISETDYQIIKSYEYYLVGKEVEYDIKALHQNRQLIRDEINTLESEMYVLINEHLEATGV